MVHVTNICLFEVLEARLSDLEARLFIVENHPIGSQVPFVSAEAPSVANPVSLSRTHAAGTQGWLGDRQEEEA